MSYATSAAELLPCGPIVSVARGTMDDSLSRMTGQISSMGGLGTMAHGQYALA